MTVKDLMKKLVNCDPNDRVRYYWKKAADSDNLRWQDIDAVEPILVGRGDIYDLSEDGFVSNTEPFVGLS